MKKSKLIIIILLLAFFSGAVTSLFFPFLIKLNVHSGNIDLANRVNGYQYQLTSVVLLFMAISIVIIMIQTSTSAIFYLGETISFND